jgi:uncharacterized protein
LRELAGADLIVHAGDFVALSVLRALEELAPVAAVHGNMDEPELRALLPETRVVEIGATLIGIVHDAGPRHGRAMRLAARFPDCAAVIYGHTHLPEATKHGELWIFNPGSPTERRRAPAHTLIRVLAERGDIRPELVRL